MNKTRLIALAIVAASAACGWHSTSSAQNAVLSEMYGRGVHAYYAGHYTEANDYLSMAINNGIQDPRAYYFRGVVFNSMGRTMEAEADWQQGAQMEASGRSNPSIGRSLSRFQGSARIKLEEIRQQARLQALAAAMAQQQAKQAAGAAAPARPPAPTMDPPPAPTMDPAAAGAPGAGDPFGDNMAAGNPNVVADDALEGAMEDPFADDAAAAAGGGAPAGAANPFGGDAGGAADPFGGGGGADDPFGGGGGGNDPFGGGGGADDPFGAGGGGGDPFGAGGNDPFGGGGGNDPFN